MIELNPEHARQAIVDHTRRLADAAPALGRRDDRTAHHRSGGPAECSDDALDAPVFNPAADGRTGTRFWLASGLNEAVVHGVAAAAAAALVDNHFAMLTSPTWELRRPESAHALRGTGQTLRWTVTRRPAGAVRETVAGEADATVTGPAGTLLLTLTRRLPVDEADVTGTPTSSGTGWPVPRTWPVDQVRCQSTAVCVPVASS